MLQENLKPLKMLVISMGLLLLAGLVFVTAVLVKKAADTGKVVDCRGGAVNLKGHGVVTETAVDGQVMRLSLEKSEGKSEVVMVDICTGETIGVLSLETDTRMPIAGDPLKGE